MNKATSFKRTPMSQNKAIMLAVAALATLAGQAAAQVAGPAVPGAGNLLQEINPLQPAAPSRSDPRLSIVPPPGMERLPPTMPFDVKSIGITGNTIYATETLHALVADAEGNRLTLAEVAGLADRITRYYREQGYPLARAIVPAQTIENGVVRIAVVEARYGQVVLNDRSGIMPALPEAILSPLQSGDAIAQDPMDRALLLLSDIPGVGIHALLRPGAEVGTSDLVVDVVREAGATGSLSLDNSGNRYTGRARLAGAVQANNLLGTGDVLSAGVLTSGERLNYGRLGYDTLVSSHGTRAGITYAELRYKLGGSLSALDARGGARNASVWLSHPLLRQRDITVYARLQADRQELRDRLHATGIRNDRHLDNWSLGLNGDMRDALLGGGITQWNLSRGEGRVGFDDPIAWISDSTTANTTGRYAKWQAGLSRLQRLDARSTLSLSWSGQLAEDNLDSSQKLSIGGPYSVRAYDAGVLSGDTGYQASVEWRRDLGRAGGGHWQGMVFVDSARVTINKRAWAAGKNDATLSGAGLGLSWTGPERLYAKAHVATPLGSKPALVGNVSSVRAWLEIGKVF